MQPNPPPAPAKKANSRPPTFPPDPKPKLTILKVAQRKGQPDVTPVPFLNPDPHCSFSGML